MARPLRVDVAGGWYHVMARGINRQAIFSDDKDRWHFLDLLGTLPERFRLGVHAYVCMENHYHLIVSTPDANLSRALHWLNVSYSAWYNRRHQRAGPLFQGRFKSGLIEGAGWGYELSVYVHLNPLRIRGLGLGKRERAGARLGQGRAASSEVLKERLKQLRAFRWSSYPAYAGYRPVPEWLETGTLLELAAKEPGRRTAAYRKDVRTRLVEGADPDTLDALRERVAIGSAMFVSRVKEGLGVVAREAETKRELRRRILFKDILKALERVSGDPWPQVLKRHGDARKWVVLWLARRHTGMTLSELGQLAGARDYAAVGIGLRRLETRLKHTPELRQLAAQMEQMLYVET